MAAPNLPQFNALTSGTSVVTLGIGGNDIGFSGIIEDCASLSPFGSPCRNRYVVNGVDQLAVRIQQTAPKVAAVIQGIHQRSPSADVFVVGYPTILPDRGYGCWPSMPIAWLDVPYLRSTHKSLNAMLAQQAQANGAIYVDVYTPASAATSAPARAPAGSNRYCPPTPRPPSTPMPGAWTAWPPSWSAPSPPRAEQATRGDDRHAGSACFTPPRGLRDGCLGDGAGRA